MFSPTFLACCTKSCIYLIEQITVANLNPNWFQMENSFFQQSRCFAVWYHCDILWFVQVQFLFHPGVFITHSTFQDVMYLLISWLLIFMQTKFLCNTLNYWIFFCEPITSTFAPLIFSLSPSLCNKHQHMKMQSVFILAFLWLYWKYSWRYDRKQGERGGVTCSKGNRAGSRTQVRCRASARGAHALPTELNGAQQSLFMQCSVSVY